MWKEMAALDGNIGPFEVNTEQLISYTEIFEYYTSIVETVLPENTEEE